MADNFLIENQPFAEFIRTTDNGKGPPDSFIGKYYTRLTIGKYKRTRPFETGEWKGNLSIFLPLPMELTDENYVNYSDVNLSTIGNIMNQDVLTGAGAVILNNVGNILGGVSSAALTAANKGLGKAATAVAKASDINAETITSAVQQIAGVAPNPNPSVQFTGPDLREFNFSWTLYPKSPRMSKNIDQMIKKLKAAALPGHSFNNSTAILNYPDLCQINFFPWDSGGKSDNWGWTDKSIIRIKKCFIKNVRVNYSEQGNPSFFQGTELPTTYRINLTLQETEYMLSKDWGGSNNFIGDAFALNTFVDVISTVSKGVGGTLTGSLVETYLNATLGTSGAE